MLGSETSAIKLCQKHFVREYESKETEIQALGKKQSEEKNKLRAVESTKGVRQFKVLHFKSHL